MDNVIIYTDGACSGNPGPGGWGSILMYKDKKKEISGGAKETTNNIMEMTAVIEALKLLKYPCDVLIYYVDNDSTKSELRYTKENGLYAFIYINGSFVGVNYNGKTNQRNTG